MKKVIIEIPAPVFSDQGREISPAVGDLEALTNAARDALMDYRAAEICNEPQRSAAQTQAIQNVANVARQLLLVTEQLLEEEAPQQD